MNGSRDSSIELAISTSNSAVKVKSTRDVMVSRNSIYDNNDNNNKNRRSSLFYSTSQQGSTSVQKDSMTGDEQLSMIGLFKNGQKRINNSVITPAAAAASHSRKSRSIIVAKAMKVKR